MRVLFPPAYNIQKKKILFKILKCRFNLQFLRTENMYSGLEKKCFKIDFS